MQAKRILRSLELGVPLVLVLLGCRNLNSVAIRPDTGGPVAVAPPSSPSGQGPGAGAVVRVTDADQLHVAVTARSAAKADARVADRLEKDVTGALVNAGYSMDAEAPDVTVSLTPEVREKDRLGSFRVFAGKVDARAERVADRKVLGQRAFKAEGRRELGEDKALDAWTDALAPEIRAWAVSVCTPRNVGLAARTVWVKLRRKRVSDAAFATRFVQEVQGIAGVTSCKLVHQDYGKREMTFRIVYMPEKLPGGLLNAIGTIPELKLEPRSH